jgi:hypothetical protein
MIHFINMIKRIGLVLVWGLVAGDCYAQNFEWANKGEKVASDPLIAIDASGNSYVCGSFIDTCTFGTSSLISAGDNDIFLCKYNSLGFLQWAQRAGGILGDGITDVCSDVSGNIYMTGVYNGPADFGGAIISGHGSFVAKYSPTGSLIWIEKIDSLQATSSSLIAINDSGNLFITGSITAPANFGCASINAATTNLKFIACYDTSGSCLWVQTLTLSGYMFDMSIDNNNNAYLTGAFLNSVTFGTTVLNSAGSQDIYLAKCNSNGTWEWALSAGSTNIDQGLGVDADPFGHVYLTGSFQLTVPFGCVSMTSTGVNDIFTACYDTSGNCIWVRQAGGGFGNQYPFGLSSDNNGNCIITGSIIDTTYFGNFTLIPNGEKMYVAKYDSAGVCQWAGESTGISGDRGTDMGTDSLGNVYVAGPLWDIGIHTFGNYNLTSNYYSSFFKNDIFVAKINNLGVGIPNFQSSASVFQLYPNPATSTIQLIFNIKQNAPVLCEIINVMGERVFRKEFKQTDPDMHRDDFTLNVSFLPKGMYVVRVRDGTVWENKKLVVQ